MSAAEYDVAIIGYGPTGVTAANLLGGRGLRVLVVERDADIYSRARAISTDEEVVRIWQRIGLAERLKQDMLSERPIDYVDAASRSFLSLVLRSQGSGHPPQMFIYQPALEQVLRDGVDRYPNVEIRLEHEALRIRQDADGVDLTLLDVPGNAVTTVRARYVIAADGGSSATRALLGVGFEGRTYEDRWVVIDTEVVREWPTHDHLRFHCDPQRPAVDCPTPLGHHRWEFPILPGDDPEVLVTDDAVWELLARHGITSEHVKILRAVVYSHHVRFAARWRIGRVFLAGDAAHVMPPWIGQGMAAGVRDVGNLCWKLDAVLRGELPDTVLDSYETERQPHVRDVTKAAVFFGRVITERRRPIARFRNGLFRVLSKTPYIGDYLRSGRWFPAARYPDGFFADRKDAPAVGFLIPQPFVLDADGQRQRLDDVTAAEWCVLRTADADHTSSIEHGLRTFEISPPNSAPGEGRLVDVDGVLVNWMRDKRATALLLRPDGFVYAAADGRPLDDAPPGVVAATVGASARRTTNAGPVR